MAVAKYFEGKNVFITGGSGFVGKALIEKLLRSCPKLGKIYVLMRSKKGRSIEERLGNILSDPLFDVIRKQNPDVFKKLIVVNGDICELNLGLSDADREMLVKNVNIIYHSAASTRFDDLLKDAIIINVRGTREVTKLALDSKHLSIFVHVSTTYCNSDKLTVDEKLYPAYISWRDAILLVEKNEDEQTMVVLTEKIIRPLLNTYVFTKLLGEHVVNDLCNGKIPATIIRPSIIVNSFEEPISGWIDNFNGPFGMISASGKGVARVWYMKADAKADFIPVDCLVKTMILATYENHSKNTVEVYNVCTNELTDITEEKLTQFGVNSYYKMPFQSLLWYPRVSLTECFYNYFFQVLMFHMLPAIFVDIALKLARKKPMLFRLQRTMFIANTTLFHFMSTTFHFRNNKMILLQKKLKEEDSDFGFVYLLALDNQTVQTFFDNAVVGIGRYLFKENMNLPEEESRRNLMKYWYADVVLKTFLFGTFIWIVFFKMNVIHVCYSAMKMFFSTEDVRSF